LAIHPDTFVKRYPLRVRFITAGVLLFIAVMFYTFPRFLQEETVVERSFEVTVETFDIPPTKQFVVPPPLPRPSIPVESEDTDIAEDITIEETELESFDWYLPPPDPEEGPTIPVVPYDEPAEPIGGYAAIANNTHYPEASKAAGIEGRIIVQAFVDIKGRVTETVILKEIPNSGFGKAASAAIKRTRFKPARKRGKPVAAWIVIPVHFKLIPSPGRYR